VPTPADPPRRSQDEHARARDTIALLALGETVDDDVSAHIEQCPECRRELADLRHVIGAARRTDAAAPPVSPPPQVWDGIAAALAREGDRPSPVVPGSPPVERTVEHHRRRRRYGRLRSVPAMIAVVALVAAGVLGWAIGHSTSSSPASSASQAVLSAQPGTASNVHGLATLHSSTDGYTLRVSTQDLPAPTGYYEVWLYNPSINQMVAVGALGSGAVGSFTVPAGLDLGAYHVVDVSAQRYDGNNAHQRSVLRGSLTSG
jgi:hypothetical protein